VRRTTIIVAAFLVVASLPLPLSAHTDAELSAWLDAWSAQEITPAALDEWRDMAERHPCRVTDCPPRPAPLAPAGAFRPLAPVTPPGAFPAAVERWRVLVAVYFPAENVDAALSVLSCESEGVEWAPNPDSTALGLWQFLRSTWNWVASEIGAPAYPTGTLDPEWATMAAAWLSTPRNDDGTATGPAGSWWSHWAASRHCHGQR
jgi:hypothetical protein